ncbi:MAG: hypothetical protein AAGA03_13585, partial [Planctomycetota bacterium]
MKLSKLALLSAICCGLGATSASAQDVYRQAGFNQSGMAYGQVAQVSCDCGEPVCGCEAAIDCGCADGCDADGCDTFCGDGCEPACGAEGGCDPCMSYDGGCDSACGDGCDSACGCGSSCPLDLNLGCCDLGDPFSLFGEHCGWTAGGWVSLGYHDKAIPLFNSRPDNFQLHQAWIYAEKAIDTSCGFDIGGRVDFM